MLKDAEAHKAEDEKRKHVVEARNHADAALDSSEKALADHGDKVPAPGAVVTVIPSSFDKVCPSPVKGSISQLMTSMNSLIDDIWEKWQAKLEPFRAELNELLARDWQEWEIPRESDAAWPESAKTAHLEWWDGRIARQREIDASIASRAEFENLYEKPYEDKKAVRVAGPFTV